MRVIISGGSGFLGSNIIKSFLESGHQVLTLLRPNSNTFRLETFISHQNYSSLNFDSIDFNEKISNFNPEIFIHSAWKGVDNLTRNENQCIEENINFLIRCLNISKSSGCKKWIGIGSLTEYGNLNRKYVENDNLEPNTPYANSKLAAMYLSKSICLTSGISWNWIRLGSIFGEGDNENWLIPYLIKSLKSNSSPSLTKCEQIWDYLHVEDAAEAIVTLAGENCSGVFNLCSSIPIKIKDIVDLVFKHSNLTPGVGEKKYSANQLMFMVGSNEKIKKSLNWKPKRVFEKEILKLINNS